MESVSFTAVVKKVESKTLVSLDKSARLTAETEDLRILEIGTWPGDECVRITVERIPKGQ